jgi:hypothetical protein
MKLDRAPKSGDPRAASSRRSRYATLPENQQSGLAFRNESERLSPTHIQQISTPSQPPAVTTAVMWREGTWRCDFWNVPGLPTLRLYDGETTKLEQRVRTDRVTAVAEFMRQVVLRHCAPKDR